LVTERAPRDRCRLPAPSRCLDGRVATSVPTAASIAAAELGPLAWPASSLRLFSHGRAGSRDTAGRAAPPVRVPSATPGLSTDCKLQRTGRSTDRFSTDQDQDFHPTDFHKDHEKRRGRRPRPPRRALIFLLTYHPALLPAPAGSFQKGGVFHFQRLAPPCLSPCPGGLQGLNGLEGLKDLTGLRGLGSLGGFKGLNGLQVIVGLGV